MSVLSHVYIEQMTGGPRARVGQYENKQEAHHKVRLGGNARRLIRKRCRFSSFDKSEDAFDTELHFMQNT